MLNGAHLGDYNILATSIASDGLTGYALNNGGGTLEIYKFTRDPATGAVTSFVKLGDVRTGTGQRLADLSSLDLDANGVLRSIGFNASTPIPTLSVGGNLGVNARVRVQSFNRRGRAGWRNASARPLCSSSSSRAHVRDKC